ncbi:Predicted protein [Caminicella sporogenes DSM 14501]|uniref:Phosphodiester glycosidase domain-containing protein n=2 Tax=Caminicella TaxID=166484 RepID=A0A1M6SVS2_9FIRM|nr:phosphodiester glycosidase family protein [Caminicella sporogenes]RKD21914.1 hypothetical protein BET04_06580 [Caminicella sporogenes]SHK48740.1 Predicted protein [Caminicella sporogenes DSM 14501]
MNNFKKCFSKILSFILIFNMFLNFSHAEFINIYEEKNTQNISKGVTYEKILKFTDKGWLNLNVLRIDLNDKYTSLDILTSEKGISSKDSLTKLAASNKNSEKIIGAINADFFDTNKTATMGPVVKDSNLITSSLMDPSFATFNIDKENNPFIDYWSLSNITLKNETNNYILNIDFKNKPYIENRVVLLDKNWGQTSFGNSKHPNIVEMIVENDEVSEIRDNLDPITLPNDGFVIVATDSAKEKVLNNFKIGDRVSLNIETNPDIEKLKLAVGGGSVILKNGRVLDKFTLDIKGRHPRSALGINKDKNEIILLTVDGRTSSYPGATQTELANILLKLGAYDAINLDGGGSTEMIVKPLGEKNLQIANNLSDGFERRIMNGLAVLNNAPKSSIKGIIISCEDSNIFVGTSREFKIKGYDENYNPIDIDPKDVNWSVSGIDGEFIENRFIPKSTGKGIIKASFKGKNATFKINAIDNPIKLQISPSKIFIDTNSQTTLSAVAVNDEGYKAKIDLKDLILSIPDGIGEIQDNTFISSDKPSSGIIKVSLKDLDAYIQIAVGYKKVILDDFETKKGEFLSYPSEVTGNFEISSDEKKNGNFSGKLTYDFSKVSSSKAAYIVFNDFYIDKKPEKLGLWVYGTYGNAHWLRGKLTDSNGNSFTIDFSKNVDWNDWKFVEAAVPKNAVAPLKLERIYLVEPDSCLLDSGYIYIDDLTAFYKSTFDKKVPKSETIFLDKRNIHSELKNENSFRFLAHGNITEIDTPLDELIINDIANISNEMDINVFAGYVDKKLRDKITKQYIIGYEGYSISKFKNASFIKLDNSKGSIRQTDYNQWIWLLDTVKNIDSKSLFVILPKPLNFADKLEEKLFINTFKKLKEEKNIDVWILTNSNDSQRFKVEVKDGIRFVTLKSYPIYNDMDICNEIKYMLFTVNDGYVTYEIKNMYEKK